MKANFNPILPYFSLHIPLKSLYCIFNCWDILLWSTVIQITQIQLSTNTHFWVINWKPHIEIFPSDHLAFMQYGWQRRKATTAALLSPIFWLQGHIPYQKSLWELFTQDGTDQPHCMAHGLKYSGLWVSNDLNWDDHILELCRKMYYYFHMFRRLRKIVPSFLLLNIWVPCTIENSVHIPFEIL